MFLIYLHKDLSGTKCMLGPVDIRDNKTFLQTVTQLTGWLGILCSKFQGQPSEFGYYNKNLLIHSLISTCFKKGTFKIKAGREITLSQASLWLRG